MVSRVWRRGMGAAAVSLFATAAQSGSAQVAPAQPSATAIPQSAAQTLDPTSPLAPLPDIGVDWPDLATGAGEERAEDVQTAQTVNAAAETRYGWRIDGIADVGDPLLRQRFDTASTLKANDGKPANAAQLDLRAREDASLLSNLLRAGGYYDATVEVRVEAGARPLVVLAAEPGVRYRLDRLATPGLAGAGQAAPALAVKPNDPVDTDAIVAAQAKLATDLGRQGFPFAKVGEPEVVVDHATRTGTLEIPVQPGGARRFGAIVAEPGSRVFGAEHVAEIARFRPGEPYDQLLVDDLRRALIQTSLVSAVDLRPVEGSRPGTVDLAVKLAPAPPRTIAGELGYGTGEGARAELSWTHRNLFPPEGALTLRGVLGTQEQLGSVVFRRSNFRARDRVLTVQVAAAHQDRDAYDAKTYSLSGALERQTNIFFQKTWTWSLGAEFLASDERDVIRATGEPRRRTFLIGALPTSLAYDGSDDLLNPTRGFRLGGRISPELSLQGAAFGYARTQLDASVYMPVTPRVVFAARTRAGTILGAPRDQIAPSRRFYAGGGASVRGYGYQSIGPRDPNNDPIGGRSLVEFAAEARIRLFGNFGLVPFLDAGNISTSPLPSLGSLRYGTGLGVRYYSNFGPIRLDVGTPINPQKGDSRIAVYVSLGQAF